MVHMIMKTLSTWAILAALALTGCGGGGGSSNSTIPARAKTVLDAPDVMEFLTLDPIREKNALTPNTLHGTKPVAGVTITDPAERTKLGKAILESVKSRTTERDWIPAAFAIRAMKGQEQIDVIWGYENLKMEI